MSTTDEPSSPYSPALPADGRQAVAVAIKGSMGDKFKSETPPQIIASGRGKLAEEILKAAFDRGIKVRQDSDLAQLLVQLDLDTPIPSEAIIAVAEILAKVYEFNARLGQPKELP